jgi:hypothetical protein
MVREGVKMTMTKLFSPGMVTVLLKKRVLKLPPYTST